MFGTVSLTKHADIDQYKYHGYGVNFSRRGGFSFENKFAKNVIIFEADLRSSVHATNRTKNIVILGKDFTQGLDNTTVYPEKL